MKTVVLGVTGGIAAYKIPQLIKLLKDKHLDVEVVLTSSANNFVNVKELEKLTGNKVYQDLFAHDFDYKKILTQRKVDHIELADKTDLVLVVPATANLLAKLASGIADDFLTTTILATKAPVMICPAMNVNMWQHPAVKANLAKVEQLGYQTINPVAGMLACGYEGLGRLEEMDLIVDQVEKRLQLSDSLKGKKIIITGGGTREPIDDVRFIANKSSGKMGAALADACFARGAEVLLLSSKDAVEPRFPVRAETFTTAQDLMALVKKYAQDYDIVFHVAAVGDFHPVKQKGKLSSKQPVSLQLKPQIKILNEIKKINPRIGLIGFKAEYGPGQVMLQPGVDATVVNDVSREDIGFQSDDNEVTLVLPKGEVKKIVKAPKTVVAEKLLDFLTRYYHW